MLNLNRDFTKKPHIPKRFKEYDKIQKQEIEYNKRNNDIKRSNRNKK